MSDYSTDNVDAFWKVIDPDDNATGGGTASATAGAMAAGLVAMVGRLSLGKDLKPDNYYTPIIAEAEALATQLFDGCRIDSQAFEQVMYAFKLPKATDEEKTDRSAAIQAAWTHAANVPMANATLCNHVLQLANQLQGCSNPDAGSDLFCAVQLAAAGQAGCLANVRINLPSIKDESLRVAFETAMGELEANA
jgi:methenyltetrahydrofolate cyclohydrolase